MGDRNPSIGFIGAGVLGKGLATALAACGYRVTAAHSRSEASARWLAGKVPGCRVFATAQQLSDAVDLVFITTPDSAIGPVAASVNWRPGQGVVHCSGAASTEILQPASTRGAVTGALHPFQTFAGLHTPEDASSRLSGATFAVSAQGWLAGFLWDLARRLGGRPVSIDDGDRPLYHAAAVMGCAYLATLLQAAAEVWQAMGFSAEQAIQALYPLSQATLENLASQGVAASITGPTVRGDAATIHSHLEALSQRAPHLLSIYGTLAAASLPLASRRGVGPGTLSAIQELIDHYSRAECHPLT